MLIELLNFLFTVANDFAVIAMATLVVIWVVAIACYIGKQAIARQRIEKAATEAPGEAHNVISIASCQS
jgi:hypothetical protein